MTPATRTRPRLATWRRTLRVAALGLLLAAPVPRAQELSEQQVKAAFLYNFTKFVQWPAEAFSGPRAPLSLCALGRDPLGGKLESLGGKTVQGHELRLRQAGRLDDIRSCHVLFVADAKDPAAVEALRTARNLPILTVGDTEGFAAGGGIIGFVLREERVQFEINPDAAARAGLAISSQLLRLSVIARDERRARP